MKNKVYRIFTLESEIVMSDNYDEDGDIEYQYDEEIEHEVTVDYVDSFDKVKQYLEEMEDSYYYEEITVN